MAAGAQPHGSLSRSFMAASLRHARWLPCAAAPGGDGDEPPFTDLPAVLASWSEEAKQHILTVGDVRCSEGSHEVQQFEPKLTTRHPGAVADLQVARIDDTLLAATASASGGVCLLLMSLPPVPGATSADLQFVLAAPSDGEDDDAAAGAGADQGGTYLQELPDLHAAPTASVDINTARQSLLSVSGDGSICVVPLNALAQAGGECSFRAASGWAGYSQGRWVDSSTFATTGVLGGLQLWDTRRGPRPVSRSPLSWGRTGCAALDKQQGPGRQLLCLDVHPSRPNLAATGASAGSVALWDLRFQSAPLALAGSRLAAGDVWQCKFDTCEPLVTSSVAAVPPLLYCTSDGALCAAHGSGQAHARGSGGGDASDGAGLTCELLLRDACSINSFDVEPAAGQDIVAVSDYECLLLLHRETSL